MNSALALAIGVAAVYAAALLLLYFKQRSLLFLPAQEKVSPAEAGLPQAQSFIITTQDGEKLVTWFIPPRGQLPLIIYFHGNAGHLPTGAPRFAELTQDGAGLLAIDYRGYGGSTGTPTEKGLLLDAAAALAEARSRGYPPERTVLLGESLGTGVVDAVGGSGKFAGIVLESAFSSTVDVAAARYWMFPVRLLMLDTFRSDLRIGKVRSPLLFLHGTADETVPIRYGRHLFELAPEPKRLIVLDGVGHQPLAVPAVMAEVRAWIAAKAPSN
jgi:fermentation-respiration switch protein FrsA (DUF1100 family)